MGDENATDEINRILAEGLSKSAETVYHCDYCEKVWDVGRQAREHALKEHDDLSGYRSERIN